MAKFLTRILAPIAALGLSLSACDGKLSINGEEGVPLAELDTSGDPPTQIALFGPDTIVVTEGNDFAIAVDGDQKAVDALRYVLADGTLGVMRMDDAAGNIGTATVRVTMPAPQEIVMAGSGKIEADTLASEASVNIGGSGAITIDRIAAKRLDLNIAGSGSIAASGTIDQLELKVVGSGNANLAEVRIENAKVTVAGSGSTSFASDGTVAADIVGAGDVTVTGSATCKANALGSGKLTCKAAEPAKTEPAA